MTPPPATSNNSAPTPAPPRLPPDEQFWQRYSPHHEFPLSGVISAGLHLVIVALLLLAAWVALYFMNQANKPLPVEAVALDAGGGGNPEGGGEGSGNSQAAPLPEDTQSQPKEPSRQPQEPKINKIDVGPAEALKVPQEKNQDNLPEMSEQAIQSLKDVRERARQNLAKALGEKGRGGPGVGGGEGTGVGTGTGPGVGEGRMSERQKRSMRWYIDFHIQDSSEYLRQLANIRPGGGAILAIPQPPDYNTFRVYRNLSKRPLTSQVEDIHNFRQILWIDDKPESVTGLARVLDIPTPPLIAVFLPEELERHLLKLEHDYRGLNENQIERTVFVVVPAEGGTYQLRVLAQTPKH